MCYEWSGWFRKARALDEARKEQKIVEKVSKQPERSPPAQPVNSEARREERETADV